MLVRPFQCSLRAPRRVLLKSVRSVRQKSMSKLEEQKENQELFDKLLASSKSKDFAGLQKQLDEFKKKPPAQYAKEIPGLIIREAINLLDRGNALEAETKLQEVLDDVPDNGYGHCVMGYAKIALGKKEPAIEHFKKSIELNPTQCEEAHNGIATIMLADDMRSQALEHLEKAIEVNPKHIPTHMTYARFYITEGDNSKAIEYLEKAVEQNPPNAFPYTVLAERLIEAGDKQRAEEMLKLALKKEPYSSSALCTLAAVLVELNRTKEAHEPLSTVKEILENPGLASLQKGQDELEKLEKRSQGLFKYVFHRAREMSLKKEDWKTAEECSALALVLNPDNLDALRFHAMTLWRQNKLDEAESRLRTISALYPKDAKVNIMLSAVVSARGDTVQAQKFAIRAHHANPEETGQIVGEAIQQELEEKKHKHE